MGNVLFTGRQSAVTLPAATAEIGGITPDEMEAWFRRALAEDDDI